MRIRLAYGKTGLEIDLPDEWDVTVVEPRFVPALSDPQAALREALRVPIAGPALRDCVRPADKVGVIFSDITRPTPHRQILPAVLAELNHLPRENITLFNALGTHRPNTESELRGMIGDLLDRYRIAQNDSFDSDTQICVGVTRRGHEVWINRDVAACEVKVLTGFIEPHFFAGFSGGGKALMPGMAGQRTVLSNHDANMISNPNATWGVTEGNPIWEEVMEVAEMVGAATGSVTFLCNVTLNRDKEITGVFAGDLRPAHAAGCAFAKQTAMAPADKAFDIVITTNSGYPLDLNLYQAVKGMSAAAQVVRPGGAIICAADCWDGIPDHGLYGQLLAEAGSPQELLGRIMAPGFLKQDQWQAQIQAQLQLKADIYVYTGNLTDEQLRRALLRPCHDILTLAATLRERIGPATRICVLPEGPQTIPYLLNS
jgi:lactate racemase